MQTVSMPIYGGIFASANCLHAHQWGPFYQCKVSLAPYMGAFLRIQNVPVPIYGGLFASAKCPHHSIRCQMTRALDTDK